MSRTIAALALVALFPLTSIDTASAGGAQARVTGPHADGRYRVETLDCGSRSKLAVEVHAEGRVRGERRTLALAVEGTREPGVYALQRHPDTMSGEWILRLTVRRYGQTVTTIAPVQRDGRVGESSLAFDSDGKRECAQALRASRELAAR